MSHHRECLETAFGQRVRQLRYCSGLTQEELEIWPESMFWKE